MDLMRLFEINLAYGPFMERNLGKGAISEIRLMVSSELFVGYKLSVIITICGPIVGKSTIFFPSKVFTDLLCTYAYKEVFGPIVQLNTIMLANFFVVK
jgi:hypothetical protein